MPSIAEKEKIKAEKAAEKARNQAEKTRLKAEKEADRLRLKNEKEAERKHQLELKTAEKLRQQKEKESERLRLQEEKLSEKQRLLHEKAADKQRQAEEKLAEKLKQEEEKRNEEERKKQQFMKFFKKLDKVSNVTPTPPGSVESKTDRTDFLSQSFIIKKDMTMALSLSRTLSDGDRQLLQENLLKQSREMLYLQELRSKLRRPFKAASPPKCQRSADVVLEDPTPDRCGSRRVYRAKLLQFWENCRPPYYGTWRQKCDELRRGRRPFLRAYTEFDYDFDSEAEWEEEPADADECKSEDEDSVVSDDEEDEDGFIVEHGYLSSDEEKASDEGNDLDTTLDAETRRTKMKVKAEAWKAEKLCKKWEKLKPVCIVNPSCSILAVKPVEVHHADLFKSLQATVVETVANLTTPQKASASAKNRKRRAVADSAEKRAKITRVNLIEAYCTPIAAKSRNASDSQNLTPKQTPPSHAPTSPTRTVRSEKSGRDIAIGELTKIQPMTKEESVNKHRSPAYDVVCIDE